MMVALPVIPKFEILNNNIYFELWYRYIPTVND
jgi:hypothetical protein